MFEIGSKLTEEGFNNFDELSKNNHQLVLKHEKRNGKIVSLIGEFKIDNIQKKSILKLLKTNLATGGTINQDWIIIQGDKKDKIIEILTKDGWKFRKK